MPKASNNHDISSQFTKDDRRVHPYKLPNATTRNLINKGPKLPIIGATSTENLSYNVAANLEDYIVASYYDNMPPPSRRPIFDQRIGHFRPQLKKNRVNRIIVYNGCFNPPHRAHQALLNLAFSCAQDLNVIAAIVVPVGDSSIRGKHFTEEVCFTIKQRVRLWTGDGGPHDWLWVYDRGRTGWEAFREILERNVSRDGFPLEFINVIGPDHFEKYDGRRRIVSGCDNTIISDVGRKAGFVFAHATLTEVRGCGHWKPISSLEKIATQKANDTASWLLSSLSFTMLGREAYNGLVEEIKLEFTSRMKRVRVCRRRGEHGGWIRFIPSDSNSAMGMSSTDIRRTLVTYPPDELLERLRGKALHPEILVQLMQEKSSPT
ncbi:hypothetical protein F4781DRAFT_254363 [Annulohypoxylon bovei var. microspora]|nr:hypothetical protein F4781DRAFT_254363 [Annulohypoxylon bovei var. microspora]